MSAKPQQLELLDTIPPISFTRLEAPDSPKKAYYEISIIRNGTGFLIRKSSGAEGSRPNVETWHRPNFKLALVKKGQLIAGKLNPKRKSTRLYIVVVGQPPEFEVNDHENDI